MSHTADAPYLDLSDPAFSMWSADVAEARERSWYARTNYGLAVLRYDEVRRLMKDPRLRQGSRNWAAINGVSGPWADWWTQAVLNLEGDAHARLRRLINPAFSPRLIEGLLPRFQTLASELIHGFVEDQRCEFMKAFAEPYATRVIAMMLGLPDDEWRAIAGLASTLGLSLGVTIKQDLPQIEDALEGLYRYADAVIADRREHPADDFMSRLVAAEGDHGRLTTEELRVHVVLLIFGGIDTTRNQLGLAMELFATHPDQWDLLAARPELARASVEEVMRLRPTVTWVTREALEDFEFQGLEIASGTVLHLFSATAGTDPREFDPPTFDIAAERSPHFGFGGGVHHCVGHFVARGDMTEALRLLSSRLSDLRLDGAVNALPASGNTGPTELPLAFSAR